MSQKIKLKLLREEAIPPVRQTEGSAGMDLHACLDEPVSMEPGEVAVIPTGIAIELPEGFEAQVRARSGLAAKHAVGLANGIGTIDWDYRGEINVILINWGKAGFTVQPGMRIAQLVMCRYESTEWEVVEKLNDTERGDKRFGSTGIGGLAG